jgi:hypothetical protein
MKTLQLRISNELFEYLQQLSGEIEDEEMAQVIFQNCKIDRIKEGPHYDILQADGALSGWMCYNVATTGQETVRFGLTQEDQD